jgi:hypothetical protein
VFLASPCPPTIGHTSRPPCRPSVRSLFKSLLHFLDGEVVLIPTRLLPYRLLVGSSRRGSTSLADRPSACISRQATRKMIQASALPRSTISSVQATFKKKNKVPISSSCTVTAVGRSAFAIFDCGTLLSIGSYNRLRDIIYSGRLSSRVVQAFTRTSPLHQLHRTSSKRNFTPSTSTQKRGSHSNCRQRVLNLILPKVRKVINRREIPLCHLEWPHKATKSCLAVKVTPSFDGTLPTDPWINP